MNTQRILIIDDARELADAVAKGLKDRFTVINATTIRAADELLAAGAFDLILLDVNLPDGDGYRYCAKLKNTSETQGIPVIFLTANEGEVDKVLGFSLGAEDYMTKPFHLGELRARIEARLKRAKEQTQSSKIVRRGDLVLDLETQHAAIMADGAEQPLVFTPHEFMLLAFLAQREDQVFDRTDLITQIWGRKVHVTERTIDTHVSNLRKKLGASHYTIRAVHGVGYKFGRKADTKAA